jgi:hypothetical protein
MRCMARNLQFPLLVLLYYNWTLESLQVAGVPHPPVTHHHCSGRKLCWGNCKIGIPPTVIAPEASSPEALALAGMQIEGRELS